MKLNYFSAQTLPKGAFGSGSKSPRIAFGKNGAIQLNAPACELIGLSPGDKVTIAQDEDDAVNWYIFKDKANGYELRAMSDKKSCGFNHGALCQMFRQAMDLEDGKTHGFLIAGEPTFIQGDKTNYYGILIPV